MDKEEDVEALIGDNEDCWHIQCGESTPVGVCLAFTRVNALPIWLCVHALETKQVGSPVNPVAHSTLRASPMASQAEPSMGSLIVCVILLIMLSASIIALLLVAKRSIGLQKTIILVVYSLSDTLGILLWASMGTTKAEIFAVFIPLTMGVGASVGLGISHAYGRRRMESVYNPSKRFQDV